MAKKEAMSYEEKLVIYDGLVALCKDFERKGKTMPYTSANGYMFSLLNKAGELGIRLPKPSAEKAMEKHNTTIFKSHGAVIKDYVLMPESLWSKKKQMVAYLEESYKYVMSLKPK